jgi:PTS system ascorbate-specific IIA component
MIGLLLVTHGATGQDLLATATQVLGARPPRVAALAIAPDCDPETMLARGRELIAQLDDGSGVLVLADMFGATPCNIAARLLADPHVEGVAGLSLPMLVRALSHRQGALGEAVASALSGGVEGVLHMNPEGRCDAQR